MSFLRVLIAAFLILPACPAFAGQDAAGQELLLILDASGSMLAQKGGEAKIAIAKRVLVELADGLRGREGLSVGVRVYGHQFDKSKKNCQDSRLEIPIGAPDPAKVRNLTGRVKAQGQTPIAYSLQEAKKDFSQFSGTKRSIILITDGIESCDGDPCAAAKELAAKGIDVKINVVGFDLAPGELEKLKCLAAPSGGLVLGATGAGELKGALDQVVKKALAENLVLKVLGNDRKPIQCFVEVFSAGTDKRVEMGAGDGKHIGFDLPAGSYDLSVRNNVTNELRRIGNIAVDAEKITEKEIIFARAGIGGIVRGLSGSPVPGRIEVFAADAGGDKFVTAGEIGNEPKIFDVPPGTYKVKLSDDRTKEVKVFESVVVADGAVEIKEAAFGEARITISAKDMAGNPTPTTVEIKRVAGETEEFVKAGEVSGKPVTFFVAPGNFKAIVSHDKTKERKTLSGISLADGQEFTKEIAFGMAKLSGFARDASGQPVAATIEIDMVTPAGERTIFLEDNGIEPRIFTVAPGTYKMVFQRKGTGERKVIENITIENGQEVKKEMVY